MKILFIHNKYLFSGGEDEVVRSEKELLEKNGHQVILYERKNDEINQYSLWKKIRFIVKDSLLSNITYNDVSTILKKEKPDCVHIHNIFLVVSPSVYKACQDQNIPVIQTLHNYRFICPAGTMYRDGQICQECITKSSFSPAIKYGCWRNSKFATFLIVRIIRFIHRKNILRNVAKKIIVLSRFSLKQYEGKNLIEQAEIKPNFIIDVGNEKNKEEYILYVGTLQPWKGIMTLIQAYNEIDLNIPLKIVGDGPLEKEIRGKADLKKVQMIGKKPQSETLALIKKTRLLVLPSECFENFPRVIVEAYACGTPVVVSNIGAMAELVRNGETGLYFEVGNSEDLKQKIMELITNEELWGKCSFFARKEYENKFTPQQNYDQLIGIYKSAMEKNVDSAV